MTIQVQWHTERRIIHYIVSNSITHNDIIAARARLALLVNVGDPPVYILLDFSKADKAPSNPAEYQDLLVKHPHIGWYVVIQQASLKMRLTTSLAQIVNGMPMKLLPFIDHALAFLRAIDPSLPDSASSTPPKANSGRF